LGGDGAEVATSYSLQEADAKPEALQFCCSRRWIVDMDTPTLLVGSVMAVVGLRERGRLLGF